MAGKLSRYFGAQDMTVGHPWRALVTFSVPLLIGNLAQQLYNTVDSIVVGKYVGDTALAAVGASGPLMNLLLVLFMGISTGAGIMVSQYFGAKQREELSKTVGTAITLTFLAGIFIMVVGPLLTQPMMSMLNTPADIYDGACAYLTIIFLGILGAAYYNILSGILRGLGDSVMPLVFLLVACGMNIVLDLLFVAGFKWGVPGVAWATIISQIVSGILCMIRLLHMRETLDITWRTLRPEGRLVGQVVRLGLPSGLAQAIFSMAAIVVQSLTNSLGTLVIAVSTMVMRVDGFAMMPNFTFGMAMTTFAGQNIGAGLLDRVEQGTKDGLKMGLLVSAVMVALILIFGRPLMSLFTNTQEVVDMGVRMMYILGVGYIAMAVTQILSGVMRGAGDTMTPMWISLITTVVIRVPIAYGLAYLTRSEISPNGAPESLFISLLVSWVLGAVITAFCYKRGKWRTKGITVQSRQNASAVDLEAQEGIDQGNVVDA
ncbi:MAG: MATE family efflux transporter [Christensenellales bacterium]|jgi:putative MATE family efflux protein